jgi:large subunit ribosomal protein L24
MKIHSGDTVLVTAGKDKGRTGKVQKVMPKIDRVVVQEVNIYKKARKAVGDRPGGMIEFSRPLPVASVALICPKCGKQTRVKMVVDKQGEKTRSCVKCGAEISTEAGKGKK